MTSFAKIGTCLIIFVSAHAMAGEGDWTLEKDEESIAVYTRAVPGWPVRQFRGVAEIEARIESLLALLDDNAACERWIHNCISSEAVELPDRYNKYSYIRNKAPWPVKKRDAILLTTVTVADDRVEITGTARPDYRPRERKFVRIPRQEIRWLLTPLNNGKVQVVFEGLFDPGGSVPNWAVNRTLIDTPFETLKDMREVVREPQYRDTVLQMEAQR